MDERPVMQDGMGGEGEEEWWSGQRPVMQDGAFVSPSSGYFDFGPS